MRLTPSSPTHTHTHKRNYSALTALRNVAEDCVDSDFNARLPTNRRTDILKQLNGELPEILPRLFQVMARTYEGMRACACVCKERGGCLRVCLTFALGPCVCEAGWT